MPVTHLDHVAVATPDLDTASAPYLALGLHPEGPDEDVETQGVRVRTFQVGETLIELLMPTRPDSPIAVYLDRRGPGLHHTAYRVADLAAEMSRLRGQGARFLSDAPTPGRAGTRVAFLHPKWGAGTLIELVEHSHTQADLDGTGV
ncbi:methylmalonyl-CoA epimerase [Deinococcus frigens]|uniref:methylmalonyl-CoA epimerase n=1 Tax=Deinococcus frigens TaxID=249403 RepID=UPI0004959F33|nr:methylmalonyl-CoA epimerase [Deinococcus frigens]